MSQLATHSLPKEKLHQIKCLVLDFDGVMSTNSVFVHQDGSELVECSRSDGMGISLLKKIGITVFVLSKEKNPVVSARCKKLQIDAFQGIDEKLFFLKNYLMQNAIDFSEVAFIGNDINDLECLNFVALPMIVADAHESVVGHGFHQTKKMGGRGAVREVCDLIIQARQYAHE